MNSAISDQVQCAILEYAGNLIVVSIYEMDVAVNCWRDAVASHYKLAAGDCEINIVKCKGKVKRECLFVEKDENKERVNSRRG